MAQTAEQAYNAIRDEFQGKISVLPDNPDPAQLRQIAQDLETKLANYVRDYNIQDSGDPFGGIEVTTNELDPSEFDASIKDQLGQVELLLGISAAFRGPDSISYDQGYLAGAVALLNNAADQLSGVKPMPAGGVPVDGAAVTGDEIAASANLTQADAGAAALSISQILRDSALMEPREITYTTHEDIPGDPDGGVREVEKTAETFDLKNDQASLDALGAVRTELLSTLGLPADTTAASYLAQTGAEEIPGRGADDRLPTNQGSLAEIIQNAEQGLDKTVNSTSFDKHQPQDYIYTVLLNIEEAEAHIQAQNPALDHAAAPVQAAPADVVRAEPETADSPEYTINGGPGNLQLTHNETGSVIDLHQSYQDIDNMKLAALRTAVPSGNFGEYEEQIARASFSSYNMAMFNAGPAYLPYYEAVEGFDPDVGIVARMADDEGSGIDGYAVHLTDRDGDGSWEARLITPQYELDNRDTLIQAENQFDKGIVNYKAAVEKREAVLEGARESAERWADQAGPSSAEQSDFLKAYGAYNDITGEILDRIRDLGENPDPEAVRQIANDLETRFADFVATHNIVDTGPDDNIEVVIGTELKPDVFNEPIESRIHIAEIKLVTAASFRGEQIKYNPTNVENAVIMLNDVADELGAAPAPDVAPTEPAPEPALAPAPAPEPAEIPMPAERPPEMERGAAAPDAVEAPPPVSRAEGVDLIEQAIAARTLDISENGLNGLHDEIKAIIESGYTPTVNDESAVAIMLQHPTQLYGSEGAVRMSAEIGTLVNGQPFILDNQGTPVGVNRAEVQSVLDGSVVPAVPPLAEQATDSGPANVTAEIAAATPPVSEQRPVEAPPPLPPERPADLESPGRGAIEGSGSSIQAYDPQVAELQRALVEAGYDVGTYPEGHAKAGQPMIDGLEGPLTRGAIEDYAQAHGLDPQNMNIAAFINDVKQSMLVTDAGPQIAPDLMGLNQVPNEVTVAVTGNGAPHVVYGDDGQNNMYAGENTISDSSGYFAQHVDADPAVVEPAAPGVDDKPVLDAGNDVDNNTTLNIG